MIIHYDHYEKGEHRGLQEHRGPANPASRVNNSHTLKKHTHTIILLQLFFFREKTYCTVEKIENIEKQKENKSFIISPLRENNVLI